MGIHDRDYMRDLPNRGGPEAVGKFLQILLLAILLVFSVRFPMPLIIKLPLMIGIGYLIYRVAAK